MTYKDLSGSHRPIIAAILSLFLCGFGQIYLGKISRGLILLLTFSIAVVILGFAIAGREFRIISWGEKQLMFNPSRSISLGGQTIYVKDIMKVTGTIQLVFTWVFSIVDAWREGRR